MCEDTLKLASLSLLRFARVSRREETRKELIISGSNPRSGCVKKRDASALAQAVLFVFFFLPFFFFFPSVFPTRFRVTIRRA